MFKYSNMHSLMFRCFKQQNGIGISEKEKQKSKHHSYTIAHTYCPELKSMVMCAIWSGVSVRGVLARDKQVLLSLVLK